MSHAFRTVLRATSRASLPTTRPYHTSYALRMPYKNSQDRGTLRPGSTEHTNGRDDDVASKNPDAAFNPNKTSPEAESETARQETGDKESANPLHVSGANRPLSTPTGDEKTIKKHGAGKETSKGGASSHRSAEKSGHPGRA